jgi:hypothetical protein
MDLSKDINFSITLGDHKDYYQQTKITVTLYKDPYGTELTSLFNNTGLDKNKDVVIQSTFTSKIYDPVALGESIGTLKNYMYILQEPFSVDYSELESVNNTLKLTFGVQGDPTNADYNDFVKVMDKIPSLGIQNAEVSLALNQKVPTSSFDVDEQKLTAKFSANLKCNQNSFDTLCSEMLQTTKVGVFRMLPFFASASVDMKLNSFDHAIEKGIIPWPQDMPKVYGFVGAKQLLLPLCAQFYTQSKNENPEVMKVMEDAYTKVYETVAGITEIKIGSKNFIMSIKFEGFDLFNGFLPEFQTIKDLAGNDAANAVPGDII